MKTKIAIIAPEVLPIPPIKGGAVESDIYEVITRLPKSTWIYCFSIFDNNLPKCEIKENIKYLRFKPGIISKLLTLTYRLPFKRSNSYLYWLTYSLWCAWKTHKIKPDIIHIHNRIQFIPIIRFLNPKTKIILHLHQLGVLQTKNVWNEKILKKIDLIIGCSKFLAEETRNRFPNYKNVIFLYNGFNQNRFSPYWLRSKEKETIREKFKISDDEKVILYVGRLVENKGIHLLIRAFAKLVKKFNRIKLVIVGGEVVGDPSSHRYFLSLRELVNSSEGNNIVFTGRINYEDIYRYYLLGDILVVPSIVREGLGNIAIEAMATGIPVISSDRGGLAEIVRNDKNGLTLSEIEDVNGLTRTIERLIINDNLRITLGKNGFEYVKNEFSWEKITNDLESIYSSLMRKKNVLIYECSTGFGGSANALADIVNYLDKDRFHAIALIKNIGSQIEKIKNTEIIKLTGNNMISETIRIYLIIKQRRIDLVHINNNIIGGIPAIIAAKFANVPCVSHIRQTRKLIKREKVFMPWLNKIILINNAALKVYQKDIIENKIKIIHDGIDLKEFSSMEKGEFKKEFNLDSQPIVGLVGRIIKGKGQKEFILAAKEVLKVRPDVKFIIVGDSKGEDDRYYTEVKDIVERWNLTTEIIFTGWRTDIKNVISDFDILVQATTTYPEGFGLTIIEAMALEKPVIATNIPGPSELVVNGETGFLISPQDYSALANSILELVNNPELAKQMGDKGRKRVEELFDIKGTLRKIEETYEEILLR